MMDPVLMRDTVICTTWNAHRADPTSGPGLLSIEDGDISPDVQFVLGMKDPPLGEPLVTTPELVTLLLHMYIQYIHVSIL